MRVNLRVREEEEEAVPASQDREEKTLPKKNQLRPRQLDTFFKYSAHFLSFDFKLSISNHDIFLKIEKSLENLDDRLVDFLALMMLQLFQSFVKAHCVFHDFD